MHKQSIFGKALTYIILIAGAIIFTAPLLWMISTALKPIEQTMTLPPVWLPYRYYAEIAGQEIPVRLERKLAAPFSVIRKADGSRMLVPSHYIKNGQLHRPGAAPEAVKVISEAAAAGDNMFVQITPENSGKDAWTLVPASAITRRVSLRWENFAGAIRAMKYFPLYLKNTLLLCFLTVAGTVFSSAMAAYGFSRIEWFGRDKVFLLALATMMIPFPVVMVPLYALFRYLGMIGTMQPLWIGSFCAGAFNVFLLRQFFMGIPKVLSDAARIDGCNEFQIFFRIILPMSKPALMVVGLFQFMATWNDFLGPLLYLTDQKDYTLALGLQFFQSQSGGTEWNYLMAASTLIVIPVIALFFFTQKSFIEGITTTGIKG